MVVVVVVVWVLVTETLSIAMSSLPPPPEGPFMKANVRLAEVVIGPPVAFVRSIVTVVSAPSRAELAPLPTELTLAGEPVAPLRKVHVPAAVAIPAAAVWNRA